MKQISNAIKYPEAWKFFIEHARNMEDEIESEHGKYRIPIPDRSGNFIYADCPGVLFLLFKEEFYKPRLESPSLYGKIQYIADNFRG